MSISLFGDQTQRPTPQQIVEALGAKRARWDELVRFFETSYPLPGEWSFGGKNYGWKDIQQLLQIKRRPIRPPAVG